MARNEFLLCLLLIINIVFILLYLLVQLFRKKEKKRSCFLRAGVMFLCPIVGPLYFVFGYLFYGLFFLISVDLEDVIFSKGRTKGVLHANERKESNLVPLEEALVVTDSSEMRNLMLSVVETDFQKSLSSIILALESGDTETAHYAASVLQDALSRFRAHVAEQYNLIKEEDKEQKSEAEEKLEKEQKLDLAEKLVDYMDQLLKQKVFTDMEQEHYVHMMDEICEYLYGEDVKRMTSGRYEAVCLRLLELEDYTGCEKWCVLARETYPNTLSSYSCLLKLYFSSGQREKFFDVIRELSSSSVVVDKETLELIRVFKQGTLKQEAELERA